jgi:hypothetical protein
MTAPHAQEESVLLPNGKALITGGYSGSGILGISKVYSSLR